MTSKVSLSTKFIGIVLLLVVVAVLTKGFPINKPYAGKQDQKNVDIVVFSATWTPRQNSFKILVGWTVGAGPETTVSMRTSPVNHRVEVPKGTPVSMRVQQWSKNGVEMNCVIQRNGKVTANNHRTEMGTAACFDPPTGPGTQVTVKPAG